MLSRINKILNFHKSALEKSGSIGINYKTHASCVLPKDMYGLLAYYGNNQLDLKLDN